jgi:hypothetical protein
MEPFCCGFYPEEKDGIKKETRLWSVKRMRRIGIRTKLVVLMVVVALVPLLAALGVLLVGERSYREEAFGRGLLSLALSEKRVMEIQLEKDIEMMGVAMTVPSVLAELNAVTERRSDVELKARDKRWSSLTESSPEIRKIQSGPIARVLGRMRADISMIAELRVTDRFGQIVAATDKCHDYYQADEEWWVRTYNAGKGAVYIPSITLDKSTRLYSAMVCVPILDGGRVIADGKAAELRALSGDASLEGLFSRLTSDDEERRLADGFLAALGGGGEQPGLESPCPEDPAAAVEGAP